MDQPKRLIFICTGNYYRSRLAELLFNHYNAGNGLPWTAESRGILENFGHQGISPHAVGYLRKRELGNLAEAPPDPLPLMVGDFENAALLIALNRSEHEPMLREKFGQIPRILARQGKLRFWNVCDVPEEESGIVRMFGRRPTRVSQPPDSGTEHIDFAIRSLLQELGESGS